MKFPEEFRYHPPGFPQAPSGAPFGAFLIPARQAEGRRLFIVASNAEEPTTEGWEHVSVSLPDSPSKCPSWPEMCRVKDLFWDPEQCVVQFHPPQSQYVNNHSGCLHLWHRPSYPFTTPPRQLVGI